MIFVQPKEKPQEKTELINLREQILKEAKKFKPIIRANPGSMIELSYSKELSDGARNLFERFKKHTTKMEKKVQSKKVVKVTRPEMTENGLEIVEEVLPFKVASPQKHSEDPNMKPGEKLFKLKEDLKKQIAIARDAEWKQREEELKMYEDEEVVDSKFYENLLDEEEELALDEEEMDSTEGETEPEEEDDVPMVDKGRETNDFVDEEAEESENDGEEAQEVVGDNTEEGKLLKIFIKINFWANHVEN